MQNPDTPLAKKLSVLRKYATIVLKQNVNFYQHHSKNVLSY